MEFQREKIMAVSRIVYCLLTIVLIITAVFGIMQALAFTWILLGLPAETVMVGGQSVALPYLFELGGTNVFIHVAREFGVGFGLTPTLRAVIVITAVILAKGMFRDLKDGFSPFSSKVISGFKKFAVALIIICVGINIGMVIFALIVWTMSLVFDYGLLLQNENDTTL